MKKIVIASAFVLALAACGNNSSDSALSAGNWKVSVGMKSIDVPGATAEQKKMMEGLAGQMQSQEQCLSQAEADKGLEPLTEAFGQIGDCETRSFDASEGKVDGELSCQFPGQEKAVGVSITGEYGEGKFDMQIDTEMQQPQLPGGKANVILEVNGERIGDC